MKTYKLLRGYKAHYIENGKAWLSKGYNICKLNEKTFKVERLKNIRIPVNLLKKISCRFNLVSRLIRGGIEHIVPCRERLIVVIRGFILSFDRNSYKSMNVFKIPHKTVPLNILKSPRGNLYWGEYFENVHNPVKIFKSRDEGRSWEIIYEFPMGEIKHIHRVLYDKYREGFWILTGDHEGECRIIFTKDFSGFDTLIKGGQEIRVADIIIMKDKMILPTDSPKYQNYINIYDFNNNELRRIKKVNGPALWAKEVDGKYLVTTVAEPREPGEINIKNKFLRRLIYMVSPRRKMKYPKAEIWLSWEGENWKKIHKGEKDIWPSPLFKFGGFSLPEYINSTYLYFNACAVKGDGNLFIYRLHEQ